jgi:archaellum component FlaC
MSFFQFSVLFGFLVIIVEIGFIQERTNKSREELESINKAIDEIKDLLASIDEKLEGR